MTTGRAHAIKHLPDSDREPAFVALAAVRFVSNHSHVAAISGAVSLTCCGQGPYYSKKAGNYFQK